MRILILSTALFGSLSITAQLTIDKLDHRLILFSGEVVNGIELKYEAPTLKQAQFFMDGSAYTSDEVKFFQNSHGFFANLSKVHGENAERYALRIRKGRMSLYEEIEMDIYGGNELKTGEDATMQDPMLASGKMYEYYNIDEKPVREATYGNLRIDLQDNEESMKHLKKYRRYKWLQMGLLGLGSGVVAYDVIRQSGGAVKFNPFMAFGIVIGGSSYFMETPKEDELWFAADAYNTEMTVTEAK
ncbi:MAG: hypothetical protein ACKVOK_15190 [Flavobacteriales bacterium]